jgi:hypothetical protein
MKTNILSNSKFKLELIMEMNTNLYNTVIYKIINMHIFRTQINVYLLLPFVEKWETGY